jgi:hypothetical protein
MRDTGLPPKRDRPMTDSAPTPEKPGATPDAPSSGPALSVPGRTTPTWEMELLISAASAFALFQIGGQIDAAVAWLEPRLSLRWATFLAMMNVYATGAVVALASAFAIHLLLRARWIALVGMNSVFPGGIRWERMRGGPIQLEVSRRRSARMEEIIERADNLSTIVFALGVALALSIFLPAVTVALLYALSVVASDLLRMPDAVFAFFSCAFGVLLAPYFLAGQIDRFLGRRLDPARGIGRLLARVLALYDRIGFGRNANTLLTLLGSNVGERRALLLVLLAMTVVFGVAASGSIVRARGERLAEWDWLPDDRAGSALDVQAPHYADLRGAGDRKVWPYLPSMVSRGPWLALVVPYDPTRHNEAIATNCPGLAIEELDDPAAEQARRAAVLACIVKLHPASIDGRPLQLEFRFHQAPDGLRGFLAMIDVRALAPGAHLLEVGRPAIARDAERDAQGDKPLQPYRIPFWR